MTHRQLFRHPVGRVPGPARWYLAALAMLSLLLTAAHFAVQAEAQRVMREAVIRTLAAQGGRVAHVRYHLLRGALTLRQVHIEDQGALLEIPKASLHVPTSALESVRFRIQNVVLNSPRIRISDADLLAGLKRRHGRITAWLRWLAHADVVDIRGGSLRVDATDGTWFIGRLDGRMTPDRVDVHGRAERGRITLSGVANQGNWTGTFKWQDVPLDWWRQTLGLAAMSATHQKQTQGELAWQITSNGLHVQGDASLGRASSLHLDAQLAGRTEVEVSGTQLPLASLGGVLPTLFGRQITAGTWTGKLALWHTSDEGWRMPSLNGEFAAITLSGDKLPTWNIQQLHVDDASADWSRRVLTIRQARIQGMTLTLHPFVTHPPSAWRWHVARLDFKDVRPSLVWQTMTPEGGENRLDWPAMHGELSLDTQADGQGAMDWHAKSDGPEGWRLRGNGRPEMPRLEIEADAASLARLRALLPTPHLPGEQGPVRMQGTAQLKLTLTTGTGAWTAAGTAHMSDLTIAQGGDELRIESLRFPIQHLRIEAGKEHLPELIDASLGDVRIEGWHYHAALHPIAPVPVPPSDANAADASGSVAAATVGDWPAGLPTAWRIASLACSKGKFTLGKTDAIWADDISLHIGPITPGKRSTLNLQAKAGGGWLSAKGWMALHAHPVRMHVSAKLSDALPFFLNNWLTASGAPRLIRGRLSLAFAIRPQGKRKKAGKPAPPASSWHSSLSLTLRHGAAEHGAFPDDPFAGLTGYDLQALLERLHAAREARVRATLSGDWRTSPPSLAKLGRALTANLTAAAQSATQPAPKSGRRAQAKRKPTRSLLAGIRLYRGRVFTYNERVRLYRVIRRLRRHRQLVVELTPRLGRHAPDAALVARVRHTQDRIERFLRARGIARRRIYPVWPTEEHRGGDTTGVDIVAVSL